MKKQILTLALTLGTFLFATSQMAQAHDGDWDSNHHYQTDKSGYWDEKDQHQKFVTNHHHRGYWDTKGDKRIFITVGN